MDSFQSPGSPADISLQLSTWGLGVLQYCHLLKQPEDSGRGGGHY